MVAVERTPTDFNPFGILVLGPSQYMNLALSSVIDPSRSLVLVTYRRLGCSCTVAFCRFPISTILPGLLRSSLPVFPAFRANSPRGCGCCNLVPPCRSDFCSVSARVQPVSDREKAFISTEIWVSLGGT